MKKSVTARRPLRSKDDFLEVEEYKNKYRQTAETIFKFIGGKQNYTNPWHCATRFRLNIKNKSEVNVESLKQLDLVKGINWAGEQLQIIIGQEVSKVVDEFKKYEVDLETKKIEPDFNLKQDQSKTANSNPAKSFKEKLLAGISGIMTPTIVVLMALGILAALQAILLQTKLIVDPQNMQNVANVDLLSGIMFIMPKVLLNGLGIFFLYNTVKYLGGNTLLAIGVGIILLSRGLFVELANLEAIQANWNDAKFGSWVSHNGKQGWLLFKLGSLPVVLGSYEGSILPFIAGGFMLYYLDRWFKTWMSNILGNLFQPTLVVLITLLGLWFVLGPILGILEFGIGQAIIWVGTGIPYGFGTALFTAAWQPLVLTGMHIPVVTVAIIGPMAATNIPSPLFAGVMIATFSQTGAGIGVLIKTKNANLRTVAIGGIGSGMFGITEPIIYGVNLPRIKPFLFGVVGAFAGGLFSGAIGIDADIAGTTAGVFSILNFNGTASLSALTEQGLVVVSWLISIGLAISLTFFLYNEKLDEERYVKKAIKKMLGWTTKKKPNAANLVKQQYENDFLPLVNEIKAKKLDFKNYTKYLSLNSSYEQKLVQIQNQESEKRAKIYQKLLRLKQKLKTKPVEKPKLKKQFLKVKQKYQTYNLDKEREKVLAKKAVNDQKNLQEIQTLKKQTNQIYDQLVAVVEQKYQKAMANETQVEVIKNMFYNGLNAAEIAFDITNKKNINLKTNKRK